MATDRSSANVFVDDSINRLAEKRKDKDWVARQLVDASTRFVLVWKHRCGVVDGKLRFAMADDFVSVNAETPILLGSHQGAPCFVIDLGEQEQPPEPFTDWQFAGLRTIGGTLTASDAALAAYAQAMVFWKRNHQFCGRCGALANSNEAGHMLDCINSTCNARTFPRSDPAVIVLATFADRVLLGRQANWPSGRYSTIAGFVEPGESLEGAVRREVAEETGHIASEVRYFSSQPWPFPSSLMLGFLATVSPQAHTETDDELEDVRWFTRADIVERTLHGPVLLPPPLSIAYRLVEHWFDLDSDTPLRKIQAERRDR